jgi:hypothetical protein
VDPASIEGVQPEGQGAATGDAPYAEYLNRVPEEHRQTVEPIFREWDGNVTRRFQEAAGYRRQWEPYEQAGLNQWRPDDLAALVEFSRQYEDPGFRRTWVEQQARELGLLQEPDPGLDEEFIDPSVQQLLDQRMTPLQQELEDLRQWRQQQEQSQSQRQIADTLESQYRALTDEHGDIDRDVLEGFAQKHIGDDPMTAMQRGFEAMQKYRGAIEQQLMRGKLNQPGAPNAFGRAATSGEAPKTLRDSQQALIERMNARMQT